MSVEVLVLHGSPGAGKSTLARAISEVLRAARVAHAVIDLDELGLVYPAPPRSFGRANLAAVWTNFAVLGDVKVILPSVIADVEELAALRAAAPAKQFMVCELTAPKEVLLARVTAREPTEAWRERLRAFVELYAARTDLAAIRDFEVSTHARAEQVAAHEVIAKAGWLKT